MNPPLLNYFLFTTAAKRYARGRPFFHLSLREDDSLPNFQKDVSRRIEGREV